MRASSTIYLAAAAALAGLPAQVSAFSNTSPFFLITTSELPKASTSTSTLSTSQFIQIAKDVISQCNSDEYVIATQPGVHASDFRNGHAGIFRGEDDGLPGMPHLKRALHEDGERGQLVVPFARNAEVNGQVVGGEYVAKVLGDWAREKCGAEMVEVEASTGAFERFGDMKPKVMMVKFEELDGGDVEERAKALADSDAFLFSLVDSLPNSRYTLIYTSTPRARVPNLSPLKSQTVHITQDELELRRRSLETNKDKDKNATIPDGSIFQRYAFFTPGVWMGYIAAFFLLSIVYAGLSALTSLKVSYAAFEKEMGPAAAKKQQ